MVFSLSLTIWPITQHSSHYIWVCKILLVSSQRKEGKKKRCSFHENHVRPDCPQKVTPAGSSPDPAQDYTITAYTTRSFTGKELKVCDRAQGTLALHFVVVVLAVCNVVMCVSMCVRLYACDVRIGVILCLYAGELCRGCTAGCYSEVVLSCVPPSPCRQLLRTTGRG